MKVPAPLLQAAEALAAQRDVSVGQVLRDALAAELRRHARPARTSARTEEQLLAPLRTLLAADLGQARGWRDLQRRLQAKGYVLREAGGGLALHDVPQGRRLCKASELGHSYASLMRRFNAPFPGHAHRYLVARHLDRSDDVIAPD